MIQIIQDITVEVAKPNFFQAIVAKQYDNNSRFLKVTLVHNNKKINVSTTSEVTINAKRNDGEHCSFSGVVNDDGTVTVPINFWMLELAGTLICDVSVIGSDESKLTTTTFIIEVESAACTNGDISTEIITSIVTVVPFERGGTNAKTVEEARQNLNYIGRNPVTADTDTPSAWIALGSGRAYISAYGYITDQPAEFGFIENDVSDTGLVKQIWHTQSGKGTIFKRAGTINGWYETSWTEVFDSKSYIPTQNGGVGANTSVDMGEAEHLECVNRFVAEMNRVASRIGMSNSTFKTPSGNCSNPINKANAPVNTDYNSYTTAFDMMRLLAAARHSPSVLSAMAAKTYGYKKNGGDYSETHGILGMSGWYNWADKQGYTLLAAKGGSLTGSFGEIGTNGILNYAMLIKATIDNRERIFGITIVGLTLTTDGYLTAQRVIKGLIDQFSGAEATAEIKDMTKKLVEGKEEEGGRKYPVGLMITDFTTSTNFEEDIQRIDGTKAGYRYHYNKDEVRAAASLTKILNEIVAISYLDNHYCSVNYDDFVAGADAAKVAIGDVVTTYDALNVMMLRSCNAYATMIARVIGKRLPRA